MPKSRPPHVGVFGGQEFSTKLVAR